MSLQVKLFLGIASASGAWLMTHGWIVAAAISIGIVKLVLVSFWLPATAAIVGGAALARRPFNFPSVPEEGGRLCLELAAGTALLTFVLFTVHAYRPTPPLWILTAPVLYASAWAAGRASRRSVPRFAPLDINAVASMEANVIRRRRENAQVDSLPQPIGLALSGGGVRSASVSFGFARALAEHGWLRKCDYVSTVSGGGWFGAMLTAEMVEPHRARKILQGDRDIWSDLELRLERARAFLSLQGPEGARRISSAIRRLSIGLLFNASMWILAVGLITAAFMMLGLIQINDSARDYINSRMWRFEALQAAPFTSVAHKRAALLLPIPVSLTLVPGLLLTLCAFAAAALGRLLAAAHLLPQFVAFIRGAASTLQTYGLTILFVGAAVVGAPVGTALALFFIVRALLPAATRWRASLLTITAAIATSLPLFTAPGLRLYIEITQAWYIPLTNILATTRNVIFQGVYLCIDCDPPRFASRMFSESADGSRESLGWPLMVDIMVIAPPLMFVLAIAVGFWVQRNALGLHEFWHRQIARGFLGGGNRDSASWPLEDVLRHSDGVSPVHIINGAANIPGTHDPKLSRHRTMRFEMSPIAVGGPGVGWVQTYQYEGRFTLARAAAISGAALSPQSGQRLGWHLALVLKLLNFGLGTWIRSPRFMDDEIERSRRLFSPVYLAREWMGTNDEMDPALYVSDGGHHDNLGLGALVDRNCSLIVLLDATCDPALRLGDLHRSLALLPDEWQVDSEIDNLAFSKSNQENGAAEIRISRRDGSAACRIVYVKTCLTQASRGSSGIMTYAGLAPAFPHESTNDQWFSVDQMRAYINIGHSLGSDAIRCLKIEPPESQI